MFFCFLTLQYPNQDWPLQSLQPISLSMQLWLLLLPVCFGYFSFAQMMKFHTSGVMRRHLMVWAIFTPKVGGGGDLKKNKIESLVVTILVHFWRVDYGDKFGPFKYSSLNLREGHTNIIAEELWNHTHRKGNFPFFQMLTPPPHKRKFLCSSRISECSPQVGPRFNCQIKLYHPKHYIRYNNRFASVQHQHFM